MSLSSVPYLNICEQRRHFSSFSQITMIPFSLRAAPFNRLQRFAFMLPLRPATLPSAQPAFDVDATPVAFTAFTDQHQRTGLCGEAGVQMYVLASVLTEMPVQRREL
jgi:hypothetical protein